MGGWGNHDGCTKKLGWYRPVWGIGNERIPKVLWTVRWKKNKGNKREETKKDSKVGWCDCVQLWCIYRPTGCNHKMDKKQTCGEEWLDIVKILCYELMALFVNFIFSFIASLRVNCLVPERTRRWEKQLWFPYDYINLYTWKSHKIEGY